MKILYVCSDHGVPIFGHKGASIHVRELATSLHRLGHEVVIVSPNAGGVRPRDWELSVIDLPPDPIERVTFQVLGEDPSLDPALIPDLLALSNAIQLRSAVGGALDGFRPDVIYERHSLFSFAGVSLSWSLGVPLIVEVNAPLADEQSRYRNLRLEHSARAMERIALASADRLVVVSDALWAWLVAMGLESDRITVMPNAVDPARFEVEAAATGWHQEASPPGPIVGFLGSLKPWHDTESLIRAMALLHDRGVGAQLMLVGEGRDRGRLETIVQEVGLGAHTTFLGNVAYDRIPGVLMSLDVAVAPYRATDDFYFSPLKLFEYMAARRPVVAADVGQVGELIRRSGGGLLYPPGDVPALADRVAELLANPSVAERLGQTGGRYVRARHTWKGNAKIVERLIEEESRDRRHAQRV